MTRKDYRLLADHMIATRDLYGSENGYTLAVQALADRLGHAYPNFNRGVFVGACSEEG